MSDRTRLNQIRRWKLNSEIDVSDTVYAKSDQLNAVDLIGGPITAKVIDVRKVAGEQPVVLVIDAWKQPYKPCLTMRRILIKAWGKDASQWIGRSMRLYRDPDVRYGKETPGGIRIAALSHIDGPFETSEQVSRGKFQKFSIDRLGNEPKAPPTLIDKWRARIKELSFAGREVANRIREAWKNKDAESLSNVESDFDALASDEAEVLRGFLAAVLEAIQ